MASILVVDDESSMREMLEILLRKQGHEVHLAADAPAAVARAAQGDLDLVVSDLRLGAGSGMDVLAAVKTHSPATEVVMITAFATAENAIQAMKLGAYDYVLKPFKLDELTLVVAKALERRALVAENRALRHRAGATGAEPELLGRSPGDRGGPRARREGRALPLDDPRHGRERDGQGGRGTRDPCRRRGPDRPFVAINCGAIPEGLLESELFGHEKGSFTGATDAKAGLFEVAGTGHALPRRGGRAAAAPSGQAPPRAAGAARAARGRPARSSPWARGSWRPRTATSPRRCGSGASARISTTG